eukprot:2170502-Pyramimonas_sp.AAC.1
MSKVFTAEFSACMSSAEPESSPAPSDRSPAFHRTSPTRPLSVAATTAGSERSPPVAGAID